MRAYGEGNVHACSLDKCDSIPNLKVPTYMHGCNFNKKIEVDYEPPAPDERMLRSNTNVLADGARRAKHTTWKPTVDGPFRYILDEWFFIPCAWRDSRDHVNVTNDPNGNKVEWTKTHYHGPGKFHNLTALADRGYLAAGCQIYIHMHVRAIEVCFGDPAILEALRAVFDVSFLNHVEAMTENPLYGVSQRTVFLYGRDNPDGNAVLNCDKGSIAKQFSTECMETTPWGSEGRKYIAKQEVAAHWQEKKIWPTLGNIDRRCSPDATTSPLLFMCFTLKPEFQSRLSRVHGDDNTETYCANCRAA
jgi:hypothetical protein